MLNHVKTLLKDTYKELCKAISQECWYDVMFDSLSAIFLLGGVIMFVAIHLAILLSPVILVLELMFIDHVHLGIIACTALASVISILAVLSVAMAKYNRYKKKAKTSLSGKNNNN